MRQEAGHVTQNTRARKAELLRMADRRRAVEALEQLKQAAADKRKVAAALRRNQAAVEKLDQAAAQKLDQARRLVATAEEAIATMELQV